MFRRKGVNHLIILKGKVVSGLGNFSYWIEKLTELYNKKTGMFLYPGTLNIQLEHPFELPKLREHYDLKDGDLVEVKVYL